MYPPKKPVLGRNELAVWGARIYAVDLYRSRRGLTNLSEKRHARTGAGPIKDPRPVRSGRGSGRGPAWPRTRNRNGSNSYATYVSAFICRSLSETVLVDMCQFATGSNHQGYTEFFNEVERMQEGWWYRLHIECLQEFSF